MTGFPGRPPIPAINEIPVTRNIRYTKSALRFALCVLRFVILRWAWLRFFDASRCQNTGIQKYPNNMTKPVANPADPADSDKPAERAEPANEPRSSVDQRLEDLEFKLMDLENTIAELNTVIIQQYDKLEKFEQRQARLLQRIEELSESSGSDPGAEPPPPHY